MGFKNSTKIDTIYYKKLTLYTQDEAKYDWHQIS